MIRYFRGLRLVALAVLLFCDTTTANADFVFNVGTGVSTTYNVGDTIRVPFVINTGGDNLAAYSIAVDLGNTTGFGGTSNFSGIAADFSNNQLGDANSELFNTAIAPLLDSIFPGEVTFDYVVSNGQSSNVSGNNVRLFDLVFKVDPGASGSYHVNAVIRTDLNNLVGYGDQTSLAFLSGSSAIPYDLDQTSVSSVNFTFTVITAVPEPSSLLLALLGSSLLMIRRRSSLA